MLSLKLLSSILVYNYTWGSATIRAIFKGGLGVQPTPPKLWQKNVDVTFGQCFAHYQFSVCKLLTVNWLKIQSKWLLSDAWFYALNSPKIVCRLFTALPQTPKLDHGGREGKVEMDGQEGWEGKEGAGEDGKGMKGERGRRDIPLRMKILDTAVVTI